MNDMPHQNASRISALLANRVGQPVTETDWDTPLASLGVDSFSALRWRSDITEATGTALPLVTFTGEQTVRDVLTALTKATTTPQPEAAPSAPAESSTLTPVQAAYWAGRGSEYPLGEVATFWYHEYERGPQHRNGRTLESDLDRIEIAWRTVVAHHPMLRTVIGRDTCTHIARHDVRDWNLNRIDLRHEEAPERRCDQLRHQLSHQVRDVAQWPLFDLTAIVLPGDIVRLCVGFDVLVIDFASWGLVMRQWGRLVAKPDTTLEQCPITFADLVRQRAHDPDRQRLRARDRHWWQRQDIPKAPALPQQPDAPRRAARFERVQRRLDAQTWEKIKALATSHGLSPTSVVLTAFALACHQRSQRTTEEGLTINLTLFDRPDIDGIDTVVGDFSSTALLPLDRAAGFDPDDATSFTDLSRAVNHRLWDVLDHRAYSGVEVARDRDNAEGWPVVFTSGIGQDSAQQDHWLGKRDYGVSQTPQVLWDHLVWEENGELVLVHDVVIDAYSQDLRDGLINAEETLLRSLAVTERWNHPAVAWDPSGQPIEPAQAHPDAGPQLVDLWLDSLRDNGTAEGPALASGSTTLTHAQLSTQAHRLAATLVAHGVRPGDLVMVALPRSTAQIVAVLAVELAQAGYVPVDPAWPARRLSTITHKTKLTYALLAADSTVELPEGVVGVEVDLPHTETPTPTPPPLPEATARPDDLAYAIFTSGSTGEPKGVAIEHRQARTTIDDINRRFSITAQDTVLGVSALSFDLSVHDIFGTLAAGGTLVLPDGQRFRDPQHWLELMAEHHVTIWNSAPPLLEMLVEYAEADPMLARSALASLRLCMLSGDWIPVTLPDRLRALAPNVRIHSLGGATEASIWSITYPIGQVDPQWRSIPYGRALSGQSFWILDEDQRPCRVAQTGELWIAGEGVAREYIGDPQLTAERFIHRPELDQRLYRTGDLGRWRDDGTIEFLGRTDRQVKIRGHRIELGEVEAALERTGEVRQCVVSAMPGPDGALRLVAHVARKGEEYGSAAPTFDERDVVERLRKLLVEQVPEYMVPSRFVVLAALPVNANGKVDHKSLENPFARRRPADAQKPAPAASPPAPEETGEDNRESSPLLTVLSQILGEDLDPEQSLTAMGTTSVQAIRIANAIEDHGYPRPALADLLTGDPIRTLIPRLELPAAGANDEAETSLPQTKAPAVWQHRPIGDLAATASTLVSSPVADVPGPEVLSPERPRPPLPPAPEPLSNSVIPATDDLATQLRALADLLDTVRTRAADLAPKLTALTSQGVELPELANVSVPVIPTQRSAPAVEMVPPREEAFPLTEMQLAYLVGRARDEHGRSAAPHFYTEALVRDLDLERFERAWATVAGRHPMLRAVITEDTRQRVLPIVEVDTRIEVRDLRGLTGAQQQRQRERIRNERSHRVLSPTRAPMVRWLAVRLSDGDWRIHLDLDLLFCDADSAVIWIEELREEYRDPGALSAAPSAHFSSWVAHEASKENSQRYWDELMGHLPPGPQVTRRDQLLPGPQVVRRRFGLVSQEWESFQDRARSAGVTSACLALDTLGQALAEAASGGSVVLTLSDRPDEHVGVVGDYTATMLLPIGVGGGPTDQRLPALQRQLAEGLDHALGPGGVHGNAVMRSLRSRGEAVFPVAVSMSLQPSSTDASQLLDGFGRTEYAISQTPQILVDVQLFALDGELVVNIDADESVVDPVWVETLLRTWRSLLTPSAKPETQEAPVRAQSVRRDVAEVFAQLLGHERLDERSSWFDLGATSLTLVSAQRHLRQRGYELDVIDLFAHPTFPATVAHLTGRVGKEPLPSEPEPTVVDLSAVPPSDVAVERARARGRRRRVAR
ncbi:non-ribosomal peptide synthetase [Natronoglycomyces albus]|uniref:Phenyloxazoline synthase MbtB n=1 Tax=Natronoglycomyces albus TaxID=2811108 RepID=A0A895XSP3_9ACTN|nr:non-ribosomal peptide synthetase [Natronoglycomyces albus]QSB06682.1 amino acid adenylation domain-containing protein [Natronoglycomyces albus]